MGWASGEREREREIEGERCLPVQKGNNSHLPPRTSLFFFSCICEGGFFFVVFFCKLAVILGFNVCVLRRVLGPDWTMRAGVFFGFFSSFPSLFNFYETILALASLRVT